VSAASGDEVFVGLDLGTSSLKGVVVASSGEVLARAQAGYPTRRSAPGRAEQDPRAWMRATVDVVRALAEQVAAPRWAGIGLSGMIPTLVLADAGGEPVGPAITWEDDRAQLEGEEFREEHGADSVYGTTGQWVDGRYLVPMFRWIERRTLSEVARATRLLSAKDFLFSWLTGEAATDPSTATGFGCFDLATGAWSPDLAGKTSALLPEVRPSTATAPLTAAAASALSLPAGLPICLGAADSIAGAHALGANAPGDCAYLWGTSGVIIGVSGDRRADEAHRYLISPLATGEGWVLEMDLLSAGSAFSWVAELLGAGGDEAAVLHLAEMSNPGSNGVSFLPYLGSGEQGALWDPELRGTIAGLTLSHARQDMARALAEGIVLESRRCLRVLDEAGVDPREIHASGGAFTSDFFTALLADATGRAVVRPTEEGSVSALGAALLAAAAVGRDALSLESDGFNRTEPDPSAGPRWEALAERHERLLAAIRSHS
jgi:sugar (pentulose or hexulose) kinase